MSSATLFLCGDVMTGRGIDQILPNPGNPAIHESWLRDARRYVSLAEKIHGAIQKPVSFKYIWGEALKVFEQQKPTKKIINLETSVTTHDDPWPLKGIQYRMNPANIEILNTAGIDCCVLANNHVLDWNYEGLYETLTALRQAGVQTAGAGKDMTEAALPAILAAGNNHRILVFSYGFHDSGIPAIWGATVNRAGVNLLPDFSITTTETVQKQVEKHKLRGDIVICSIHWGGNWGYDIHADHRDFAHRLIDEAGVDLIHGHSSHHIKGLEIYGSKLILYGCGDFITDYEGIGSHKEFRDDLGLMYFPKISFGDGVLRSLTLVPTRLKKFQIKKAEGADARWIYNILQSESINVVFTETKEGFVVD